MGGRHGARKGAPWDQQHLHPPTYLLERAGWDEARWQGYGKGPQGLYALVTLRQPVVRHVHVLHVVATVIPQAFPEQSHS